MSRFRCILGVFLVTLLFSFIGSHSSASAESVESLEARTSFNNVEITEMESENEQVSPFAEIGPTYPGTSIKVQAGDIIHSPKSVSTFFVGHIGIVGTDLNVYHVHPYGPGRIQGLFSYINNFDPGDKFTVLRVRNGNPVAAANWAKNNIGKVQSYSFNPVPSNITASYCSKFVWQAYFYGAGKELIWGGTSVDPLTYIRPSEILNSNQVITTAVFYK
ncbi:hypothetical protein [Paenibacillus tundrae]|uniref:Hydrolase n=1 Tax=Paenibacillus tundrae TaxID=528187 RepID=A0ABT9WB55_9BACL|nr:hypothetical protein [Paenibacillus tundrae]MDQ0170444.1 hypothetical protein [Paenibacillus tundrae]